MKKHNSSSNYDSNSKLINPGQDDQMTIIGYQTRRVKQIITWIFVILTIGLLRLVFYWRPDWMVKCMCRKVYLKSAEYVLLEDQYDQIFVERVKTLTDYKGIATLDSSSSSSFSNQFEKGDNQSKMMSRIPSCDEMTVSKQYFMNKKIKYIWNDDLQQFEKLKGLDEITSCSIFHEKKGLTQSEEELQRQNLYGNNSIVVSVTPVAKLLLTQALHPFYIFQLFSCALWYSDQYGWYATCILVISIVSLTVQIYQTRSMQRALKRTITANEVVSVYRPEKQEFDHVFSDMLVPGDVIEVPKQGCVMQCDAVLLNGNCIVNESMLTGESIPVTKTPIPQGPGSQDVKFSLAEHFRHVLFSGTNVIQTRNYGSQIVKAVVIRTGFSTAKGELVRSILYPKPVDFKFTQDGAKYIGVLALIALGGMIYTLVLMVERGDEVGSIITRTLDLLTIVIPPALPAAMTIGIVFAQKRLKSHNVFCISPRSINLCGAINVFCFDKTGTLTEDGLDLYGMVPALKQRFQTEEKQTSANNQRSPLVIGMATCHSLTIIEGCIAGDPLDVKMFEATSWILEEPGEGTSKYDVIIPTVVRPSTSDNAGHLPEYENDKAKPYEIGIFRQFTFTSKLQRMSVITRELNSDHFDVYDLYVKGSPEMIVSLCNSETVPADFHDILTFYTQQGYRVIAFAHRLLSQTTDANINRVQRDEVECGLTFLGFLIMENRLKPETQPIIRSLKTANIRTVMVTGDNMLTALSVARDCQMIDIHDHVVMVTCLPQSDVSPARLEYTCSEKIPDASKLKYSSRCQFAITGKSWTIIHKYFPEVLPKLAVRGVVFARFSPENKQQLIELLQDTGYYVGMCGDGANDCGALKTAHAGISLSEAEASVASPFTSKESNISCVPNVIKEGRAALVTSYGIFKFMACYSLTQFLSVCLLYWIGANLTDFTFLYIDLLLLTSLGITFCYTSAYFVLDPKPPKVSLIAVTPVLSLILQLLVHLIVQLTVSKLTEQQPWFEPFIPNEDHDYQCYEVTIIFLSSSFQYITMAIVFSKGPPYRRIIFKNYVFMINILLSAGVTIMIVVYPFQWIIDLMELKMPPSLAYRGLIVGIGVMNFIICFITETYIVDFFIDGKFIQPLTEKYINSKLKYQVIENEIYSQPDWPPISSSDTSIADLMRLEHSTVDACASESFGTENKAFTYVDGEENKVKEQKKPDNELSIKSFFSSKLQTVNEAELQDIQNLNAFLQNGRDKDSSSDLDNLLNAFDNRSSSELCQNDNEDVIPILPITMPDDSATLMEMTNTNNPSSIKIKMETNEESSEVTIF